MSRYIKLNFVQSVLVKVKEKIFCRSLMCNKMCLKLERLKI